MRWKKAGTILYLKVYSLKGQMLVYFSTWKLLTVVQMPPIFFTQGYFVKGQRLIYMQVKCRYDSLLGSLLIRRPNTDAIPHLGRTYSMAKQAYFPTWSSIIQANASTISTWKFSHCRHFRYNFHIRCTHSWDKNQYNFLPGGYSYRHIGRVCRYTPFYT